MMTYLDVLLKYAKLKFYSGKFDDSPETIQKRLQTYETLSTPVVDFYNRKGKLLEVKYKFESNR